MALAAQGAKVSRSLGRSGVLAPAFALAQSTCAQQFSKETSLVARTAFMVMNLLQWAPHCAAYHKMGFPWK